MKKVVEIRRPHRVSDVDADEIVPFLGPYDDRSRGWIGTTDHLGLPSTAVVVFRAGTGWPISVGSSASFLAEEVSRLRDQIIEVSGLTRREIASAIGVDRRSLSGFARGDIRPTPSRLESLRFLAKVAFYAGSRWGERSRDVLLSPRHGRTPLELVAAGDGTVFGVLDMIGATDTAISVEPRPTKSQPLYLMARPYGHPVVTRAGVVRDENVYTQDLTDAADFDEPPLPSRRRRIK